MSKRKIICQIVTGSNLYGTNRPDSDIDYTGIFLPSSADLLGMQNCPTEYTENVKKGSGPRNTAGDVDCKFFGLKQFFKLAAEGQPGQLEMLFAPDSHTVVTSPEWELIKKEKGLFLSKKGIGPFIGFAIAQAHKSTVKGENLNALRAIAAWGDKLTPAEYNEALGAYLTGEDGSLFDLRKEEWTGKCVIPGVDGVFDLIKNEHGFITFRVAGRQFDPGSKTKVFLGSVKALIGKYGTRSEAAAENGLDYKSLMHAYRLLFEAEEFLRKGHITLPLSEAEVLKLIRAGKMYPSGFDWHSDLIGWADHLRQEVAPKSHLPDTPNWSKINALCERMLWNHLSGRKNRKGLLKWF